jgi:hypothetical protein
MHNIVLVEQYSKASYFWSNLVKLNKTNFSVEETIRRYSGFEGELLLYSAFDLNNLNEFIKFYDEIRESSHNLLLHVLTDFSLMPESLKSKAVFMGYDVGVCEEKKTLYSSIFNEILFGNLHDLICFVSLLNENLLFPNKMLAKEYINFHNELSAQNKGVEDYEAMNLYEIWKYTSRGLKLEI